MTITCFRRTLGLAAIGLAAMTFAGAQAQTFPSKPITIIVPVPPGGILDTYSRLVGDQLQKRLGQPVVVENKPGGGGVIALRALKEAPPDGHTLFPGTNAFAASPFFVKGFSYTPGVDFETLTNVVFAPYVIITNRETPAKTLPELIGLAKASPGKLNFAVVPNSGQQLDTLDLLKKAGADMVVIPYQGGAVALKAILGNETQAYFGAALGIDKYTQTGDIKALAVTSARRFPPLPNVPTVKEATGLDMDTGVYYNFITTPNTPPAVLDRLDREIRDIVENTEVKQRLEGIGYQVITNTRQDMRRIFEDASKTFAKVAAENKIEAK